MVGGVGALVAPQLLHRRPAILMQLPRHQEHPLKRPTSRTADRHIHADRPGEEDLTTASYEATSHPRWKARSHPPWLPWVGRSVETQPDDKKSSHRPFSAVNERGSRVEFYTRPYRGISLIGRVASVNPVNALINSEQEITWENRHRSTAGSFRRCPLTKRTSLRRRHQLLAQTVRRCYLCGDAASGELSILPAAAPTSPARRLLPSRLVQM